ncbi:MAG: nickel-dependent hydrogenase large subunit [Coriobacteriales bacterium]
MAQKSIIDPVDRIEGHLRIEMEVTDGVVSDAWVSGGLFRGLELIVEGREPDDAALVAQRICGVCPTSHCHASVYAAEEAYGIHHPEGARIVRNMLEGAQYLHSHILWFYQLGALDYVNPLRALTADPEKATAVAQQLGLAVRDFKAVKDRLVTFAENGQYSWLSGGWFMEGQAPEAYKLPAEVDLIAVAHYIEALDMQATADEISAIIGGKMPHVMTSRPGGTCFYPNIERLDDILARIKQLQKFLVDVQVPDALAIAGVYLNDVASIGNNKHGRFMCYGVFDTAIDAEAGETEYDPKKRVFPPGITTIDPITHEVTRSEFDSSLIEEQVKHSYYDPYTGEADSLPPLEGQTNPPKEFPGYDPSNKYSWCKAPRYNGQVMEVGPLSRVLNAYTAGVPEIVDGINYGMAKLGLDPKKDLWKLNSAAGRLLARPVEAMVVSMYMEDWLMELVDYIANTENPEFFTEKATATGEGVGLWEAPRGALLHCEKIKDNKITHYQAVVPTAWNISPRDNDDIPGTIEQALIGTPVANVKAPINALRIVHGYDPCIACAIHVVEPKTGKEFEMHTTPWGGR